MSIRELNLLDTAYIAGLTDGEGCLNIVRQKNKNCRSGYAYRCGFRIANTDPAITQWLAQTVGAGCVKSQHQSVRNSKPLWTWDLWGDDALDLTKRLRAFLRIRAKQADLLISFQTALKVRRGPYLTESEIAFRENCYHQSRQFNCRGATPYVRQQVEDTPL